jgi:glucosamine-6-phosphate deaminase
VTRLVVVRDEREGGEVAAAIIADRIAAHPDTVLGIATGSTPLTTWAALARHRLDLSRTRAFALDEYIGLPQGHPQSFEAVVAREVTTTLGLDPELVRVPAAHGEEPDLAAARYERCIDDAGGIDIQVLGIGRNGHLAFNEPGTRLDAATHVAVLSEETRSDNARFFGTPGEVPTRAITQGLGTIARAGTLLLLAFGARKAPALAAALDGPVSAELPASVIRRHPDAIVIADVDAAAMISKPVLT